MVAKESEIDDDYGVGVLLLTDEKENNDSRLVLVTNKDRNTVRSVCFKYISICCCLFRIYLYAHSSFCHTIYLSICSFVSICLSLFLSVCLSICFSLSMCLCLFIYVYFSWLRAETPFSRVLQTIF